MSRIECDYIDIEIHTNTDEMYLFKIRRREEKETNKQTNKQ